MNVEQRNRYLGDVAAHKPAEAIAIEILSDLDMGFNFTDVSNDSKYYNKGDIIMNKDGVDKFVDIKDDGCVWKTNNFFIETGGWDKIHNCKCKGWINSDYDCLAIVSQEKKNIWLLSMNRVRKFYDKFPISFRHQKFNVFSMPVNLCGHIIKQCHNFQILQNTRINFTIFALQIIG